MKVIKFTFHSLLLVLFVFVIKMETQAQQMPFLASYNYHPEFYNPAAIGEGGISLLHRRQWLGFESAVAPKSFVLNGDFSSLLPFSDKAGIGVNIMSDKAHIFRRTNVDLVFAYHLYNEGGHRFSLGAVAGLLNQSLDFGTTNVAASQDVALYSGNGAKMGFDGGPGLYYRYNAGGDLLTASLALPQLFSGDLEYADLVQNFDNRFHLLAGVQFRKEVGSFMLEPALLFRGVNGVGTAFAKATLDVNLKALFLDNRFWVIGGTRFNGQGYLSGAGAEIGENFKLQGLFEYHANLGFSYEMTLAYEFAVKDKDYGKVPPEIVNRLEEEKEVLKNTNARIQQGKFLQINSSLKHAENTFGQAQYSGLEEAVRNTKLTEAEGYLADAKLILDEFVESGEAGYNARWISGRILSEAKQKNISGRSLDKLEVAIQKEGQKLDASMMEICGKYETLKNKIQIFRFQKNMDNSLVGLIRDKNTSGLHNRLKKAFSQVPGAGSNGKVEVWESGKMKIAYTFPYTENAYEIDETQCTRNFIVEHIAGQLQKLQNGEVKLAAIKLKMMFQNELSDMKNEKTSYPYLGEYGTPLPGSSDLYNTEAGRIVNETFKIGKWAETSSVELAFLKMHGVKLFLKEKGVLKDTPVDLEISGPNYNEKSPQTLVIEITLE